MYSSTVFTEKVDWSTFSISMMQYFVISGIYSMYVHLNFEN